MDVFCWNIKYLRHLKLYIYGRYHTKLASLSWITKAVQIGNDDMFVCYIVPFAASLGYTERKR